ncbi:hypothetical protein MHTCC0001_35140 [Flavobacteriaceae bacterium MHTCC 0001]
MKNIVRKTLFIISIYYTIGLIQSCCGDNPTENYQILNTQIKNFDLTTIEVSGESTIPYESFAIQIEFITEIIAQKSKQNSVFGTAYAQSCDDEIIPVLTNQIESAIISANVDLDNSHSAGTSLNDLFEYRRVIDLCIENGGSLEQCGENQIEFPFNETLTDVLNKSFAQFSYYNSLSTSNREDLSLAILKSEPQTNEPIQFTLDLVFVNGQTETISTEPIILE